MNEGKIMTEENNNSTLSPRALRRKNHVAGILTTFQDMNGCYVYSALYYVPEHWVGRIDNPNQNHNQV